MENRAQVREFLASRRARITPDQAGLPAYGGNRRVKGLRREEVALLAGVSIDYYIRMERGDLAGASEAVLDGVANALQLDEAEREHLRALARSAGPTAARRARPSPTTVRPVIQQVLDAITEAPAWIRNARHDILAMNPLARALYSPVLGSAVAGATAKRAANTTRFIYLDPAAREFFVDYDRMATDAAAMLRLEAGRNPHDKDLRSSPPSPTCASTSTPLTLTPARPTDSNYLPAGPPPEPSTTPARETLTTFADQPAPQQNLLAGAFDNATTAAEHAAPVRCLGQQWRFRAAHMCLHYEVNDDNMHS